MSFWPFRRLNLFLYSWLRAHAMFYVTCSSAFVREHWMSFQAFCQYIYCDYIHVLCEQMNRIIDGHNPNNMFILTKVYSKNFPTMLLLRIEHMAMFVI